MNSIKRDDIKQDNINNECFIKNETKNEIMTEASDLDEIIIHKNPINIIDEPRSDSDLQSILPTWIQSTGKLRDKKLLCLFSLDQLRGTLMPTLQILYDQDPESLPFRQPLDSQDPAFQDYFAIIKNPMDLSTIKRKLEFGLYTDPWDYVDDVWMMFNNAWLYNRKTSRVYKYCTRLSEIFVEAIDPVMQSLGYCCGRNYTFNPKVHCCYGKQLCTIQNDDKYYSYQNNYNVCQQCFDGIPGDTVTFRNFSTQHQILIMKDQFQDMKNNDSESDIFVHCKDCGRKFHQICVLYIENDWPHGFSCHNCMTKQET